jgi:hypothetical protein
MLDAKDAFSGPGGSITYMEVMDDAGNLRYPVAGISLDPVLLLIFAVTRCGGILPDEMPFNVVQKLVRAALPDEWNYLDLADNDFRKDYQDVWYGTNDVCEWLPERMRSRPRAGGPSTSASTPQHPPEEAADGGGGGEAGT